MNVSYARHIPFLFMPILIGGYQCIRGHNYSVAAQHETTTVGNIERVHVSTKGTTYFYQFSINGVRMDDYSDVCRTPLAPGACNNHGPVLVYYSYQPYANSRLEDFAAASVHAYRIGIPTIAISLPLYVLGYAVIAIVIRKSKRDDDSDPEDQKGRSKSDDLPDVIHIVPGE